MKTKKSKILFIPTVVVAIVISQLPASAADKRVPPPEAFAACVGKSEGEAVTFITHNETLSAVCRMFDGKLAAAPDRNRNNAGGNSGQITTQPNSANLR